MSFLKMTFLKNCPLQNMILYIPLERKFDADRFLAKDLKLKMYGAEVMTSYSDVIVFVEIHPL